MEIENQEVVQPPEQVAPSNPSTNMDELIRSTLAENERLRNAAEARARVLEDEIAAMKSQRNAPLAPEQLPADQEYWSNPVQTINRLIGAQIAPLQQFTGQMQQQNEYTNLKQQYTQYQGFNVIERYVDQFMIGQQPTHANMHIAIQRAVGQVAMTNPGLLNGTAPAPTNNVPAPVVNTPAPVVNNAPLQAHLRPSNTSLNAPKNDKPQRRPLTENERRLIKEWKMTEDEFFSGLEAGSQVESWKKETK